MFCHVKHLVLLSCSRDILQSMGKTRDAFIVLIRRSNAKISFVGLDRRLKDNIKMGF